MRRRGGSFSRSWRRHMMKLGKHCRLKGNQWNLTKLTNKSSFTNPSSASSTNHMNLNPKPSVLNSCPASSKIPKSYLTLTRWWYTLTYRKMSFWKINLYRLSCFRLRVLIFVYRLCFSWWIILSGIRGTLGQMSYWLRLMIRGIDISLAATPLTAGSVSNQCHKSAKKST